MIPLPLLGQCHHGLVHHWQTSKGKTRRPVILPAPKGSTLGFSFNLAFPF
jgi:hypothetical protein